MVTSVEWSLPRRAAMCLALLAVLAATLGCDGTAHPAASTLVTPGRFRAFTSFPLPFGP